MLKKKSIIVTYWGVCGVEKRNIKKYMLLPAHETNLEQGLAVSSSAFAD